MKRRLRLINFILMFVMCFGALGFSPKPVSAQNRAVSAGDIAIILMNSDVNDSLAFVALADLTEGEVIRFTDSGWYATGSFRASEGAITYTVPSGGITAGTIVFRDGPFNTAPWALDSSDLGTAGLNFSSSGDQVIALQGTAASPSFVYALNNDGAGIWQADATSSNTSALPTGLTNGEDAIAIAEIDNAKLDCAENHSGTKADLLTYISNKDNWVGDNATLQSIDGSCSFTVTSPVSDPKINEFSASTIGTDVEFLEILGDPSTDYSEYAALHIEGDYSSSGYQGRVDAVITIGTTDANGFYVNNIPSNSMENGSHTLLLVKNFTGVITDDLDTDDDGVFDVTPWDSIVDSVAVHDGGSTDLTYALPVLGVAYDGLSYSPGGASRIPDGTDTESASDWVRNDFDLAGISGYTGTIGPLEAYNTPGETNVAYTILINEVDADTPGTDVAEFLELYDGVGSTALDGLVVVFYNGNGDVSYAAYDLDTYSTDANGYFLIGNAGVVPTPSITFSSNGLQNGADAVALYMGDAGDFPSGTAVTTANLVDALVYDTSDSDDAGLLVLLNAGQAQIDEAGGGSKDTESNQRCPNGTGGLRNTDTYTQDLPSPGAENCLTPTDTAPEVSSTSPVDAATKVALDSDIEITFSEEVTLTAGWYEIDCSTSGLHTAAVTDTDPVFTLNPDTDFVMSETCDVTVFAANVSDEDNDDPPDLMESDYLFSFSTLLAPKINEFSANITSTDIEYVEVFGDPTTDYSAYTVLEIEGDYSASSSNEGTIDEVIAIGTTDANGFYVDNLPVNALENGTITLLLVKDFSGLLGNDIDADDDGVMDYMPWGSIVDSVAVHDGGSSDITYALPVLGVAYDGLSYSPGGASRIPDGYDTESTTDWVRNDYDGAGLPGYTGTIGPNEAYNTPGETNVVYVELAPTVISTVPVDTANDVYPNANIAITFSEPVTLFGSWYSISCTTSGVHTAVVTDGDPTFTLDPDVDFSVPETCTVTVIAKNVTDDDTDDAVHDFMVSDYVFSFSTVEAPEVCGDPFTPIYDIQGSGATTPLDTNTELSTEGVVVGDFQTNTYVSGTKNGFYIQAITGDGDPSTSDGVFVYSYAVDVQAGDHVRVTGKPAEYTTGSDSLTQITSVSNILTCSSGNSITPTTLSLPVASDFDYETLEGMLVTYPQALIISEYFNFDRYGEIVLTSTRHLTPTALYEPGSPEYDAAVIAYNLDKITLDDGRTAQNPDPALHPNGLTFDLTNRFRGGDTVTNVTGILDYYYDLYKLQPTQGADYLAANPRQTDLVMTEGDLTVASFNVLNYFLTIDDGSNDICSPSGTMECRGADTTEELARQRAKLLAALSDIEADVFGLMEIENDSPLGAGDAVADLVSGLNDFFGAGTYDYIDTGAIGTDAIKQALIYKPSAVTPLGAYQVLDSSYDAAFIDTLNRPVIAQAFTDNLTGKSFTVAVNHLKSKGSSCDGDPDLDDGAGNCNLTRKAAAEVLVDWLAEPTIFPDVTNYLIIGDLNSYDKEDPIDAIKLGSDDTDSTADDFIDMVELFQGDMAYGYVYDGQVGYLDYALANNALAAQITDTDIWHINADEPDILDYDMSYKLAAQDALYEPNAFRSSDHDPVIVKISLNNTPVAQDDAYETPEDVLLDVAAPGVLDNDMDDDNEDTLTAELVTDVIAGTLVLNSDGSFSFMPPQDVNGEFTFTYRVFDGTDYSNTVTVTITVTPVNDSPVAEDDYYETDWNVVLNVPAPGVLANDGDPDSTDVMNVVLMTPTQHGMVTLSANGAFTYIPDPGFSGQDSFIYALVSLPGSEREGGYSDTATVYITVHPPFTYFFPLLVN